MISDSRVWQAIDVARRRRITTPRALLALVVALLIAAAPAQANVSADLVLVNINPSVVGATTGDTVTWEINVASYGPDAIPMTLNDQLGDGETFVSATTTQGSCTQVAPVTCDLGSPAAGPIYTVHVTVIETKVGAVTHGATLGSSNDPDPSNNSATASIPITAPVVLTPKVATGNVDFFAQAHLGLASTVTPNGAGTTYFEYGKTRSYGKRTPSHAVSGEAQITFRANATGLAMNTIYHYRAVLVVNRKTYYGKDLSAKTDGAGYPKDVTMTHVVSRTSTLVSGIVKRPASIDAPGSCSGVIVVEVYTTANKNLVLKSTKVNADCSYLVRIGFGTAQARAHGPKGSVLLDASFQGNSAMLRERSNPFRI